MFEYIYEKDMDGIVIIIFDVQDKFVNMMIFVWFEGMEEMIEYLKVEEGLIGVVLVFVKKIFFVGGDLEFMLNFIQIVQEIFDYVECSKVLFWEMEKLLVFFVVVINGVVLGGGYEICLVCDYCIVVVDFKVVVGLLEVILGLLSGVGGVCCMVVMFGLEVVLLLLVEGE